jgi:NADP-dependent 3-hydroxy acid dehydrogenase YdfG
MPRRQPTPGGACWISWERLGPGSRLSGDARGCSHASEAHLSIVIVGAGPNLGAAVARRFGREGMPVGLIARDEQKLKRLAHDLRGQGLQTAYASADVRDSSRLSEAIRSLAAHLGPVEVLEYSPLPAREFMKPILETTVHDVRGPLEFSVLGAVAAATAVIGPMIERRAGSILFTTGGAAVNPPRQRAGVGISFAGEVAYARMLHDELLDHGVHVGHTAIAGRIGPGLDLEPDDIAETLWRHHTNRTVFQVRIGID